MTRTHPRQQATTPTLTGRVYGAVSALSMTIGRGRRPD